MASVKNIKAFCDAYGAKSILNTTPQKIHGVNPSLTYPESGKSFDLPRFSSVEMQMARVMNKIALRNDYINRSKIVLTSSKVLPEDLKRLESMTVEDSYKRVFWINPKDNKGYHLLDEGRTKDGMQKLRILDEHGEFVKNAEVKPKTIILSDVENNFTSLISEDGNNLTHTDIINIVARRYNPFAKYKNVIWKDGKDTEYFKKLSGSIDDNTSSLSCSYAHYTSADNLRMRGKDIKEAFLNYLNQNDYQTCYVIKKLKEIVPQKRVLMGSGNVGENTVNAYLFSNAEGVGGLNSVKKVHSSSASRNSMFTQHYEPYEFPVTVTKDGINITGLKGTDYPMTVYAKVESFLGNLAGTSYSTPVRAAKLALNEMMEGIC